MKRRHASLGRNQRIDSQRADIEQYLRAGTLSQASIARRFHVSQMTVSRIAGSLSLGKVPFERAPRGRRPLGGHSTTEAAGELKRVRGTSRFPDTGCGVCTSVDLERSSCPHRVSTTTPTDDDMNRSYERHGRRDPRYRAMLRAMAGGVPVPDTLGSENDAFDRAFTRWERLQV